MSRAALCCRRAGVGRPHPGRYREAVIAFVSPLARLALTAAAALCLASLGACRDEAPDRTEVLAQSANLVKPLPGLYRSTTTLIGFELPGADPRTADLMRDRFGQVLPQTREHCLTPEEARRGFADVIRRTQQGDCRIERFVANATRLSARMRCRSGGLTSVVAVEGTGAPERSRVDLKIVQTGSGIPGGSETISMKIDNERVGDCPSGNPSG